MKEDPISLQTYEESNETSLIQNLQWFQQGLGQSLPYFHSAYADSLASQWFQQSASEKNYF